MRMNEFFWTIATRLDDMQVDYDISDLRERGYDASLIASPLLEKNPRNLRM